MADAYPPLIVADAYKTEKVQAIVDVFKISSDVVDRLISVMESEMAMGMSRKPEDRKKSSLQMETTYVRETLDGTEEGDFLALDLGGTNFRILHMQMKAGKIDHLNIKNERIPDAVLSGPAKGVYQYLAASISRFVKDENLTEYKNLPLGFTFSFPMEQKSINSGYLVTWTKSFKCPDGVGEDAVRCLEDAIEEVGGVSVKVVAILNDTTGTMMAGAYLDHKCEIGLILGTGSNACYMEHLEQIDKWSDPVDDPKQVIIDIEWGAFGDNGCLHFIKTEYDLQVDKNSNHVGSFTFEKHFSGYYMGELVRMVLARLTKEGLTFQGKGSDKLFTEGAFSMSNISDIERDIGSNTANTLVVLKDMDLAEVASSDDVEIVRYVCSVLSIRAAQLVGSATSVLLRHINKPEATVAIDGSVYAYHPKLHNLMLEVIGQLAPATKCKLILAEDGSGRGAAFVAAVAERVRKNAKQ